MKNNSAQLRLFEDGHSIEELPLCRPFVKWAGGKAQLLPHLTRFTPKRFKRYFEPFVGGGALFFRTVPHGAFLSDVNEELINCYLVVRDEVEELIQHLRRHRYQERYFYRVRSMDRSVRYKKLSNVERASRVIFLNKTCFNGLYRVNAKGYFNVPFGEYTDPKIIDEQNLRACSLALQTAEITSEDFYGVEKRVSAGDFVYFDPPYAPVTVTSNFTAYSRGGFGDREQLALRDLCVRLNRKRVRFMVSNSCAPLILALYANFNVSFVEARRAINSKATRRGCVREVVITNY